MINLIYCVKLSQIIECEVIKYLHRLAKSTINEAYILDGLEPLR